MDTRKYFTDSVTPLPAHEGLMPNGIMVGATSVVDANAQMPLLFSLALPGDAQARLEAKVERGETVPLDELARDYSPSTADFDKLKAWLEAEGFQITHATPDRTTIYATATVGQIEKSLDVHMVPITKGAITYTAARDVPSMPAAVGAGVQAIIGLQPFRQAHKNFRRAPLQRAQLPPAGPAGAVGNAVMTFTASAPVPAPPYLVRHLLSAYEADGLNVTGAGQTIAILIDTFPSDSDVQEFWKRNGLPVDLGRIEKINVSNMDLPPPEGEETLDVEWASGIAPGARVRIYASGSLQFVDLDRALDRILDDLADTPGMRQLSISLGLGETYMGGPKGEVATQHQKFLRLAAAGVNVFVSSGDSGSNPDDSGHDATGPTQVEYEASDPCVIGVGGTSLRIDANGRAGQETGWTGSGGGRSILWKRPAWQKGDGVPPGKFRLVPDVSLVADPNTGGFIWMGGARQQYGGTSWSAPVWAAFCALINEARAKAGKPALPFLNPLLYPLLGTSCFRDVTSGTNGVYHCNAGYDMVTGLGVPSVRNLIVALTA